MGFVNFFLEVARGSENELSFGWGVVGGKEVVGVDGVVSDLLVLFCR